MTDTQNSQIDVSMTLQSEHSATAFDLSVVISTYNRCALLPSALRSVLAQEARGVSFELIVVDNNSRDDTRQVVDSFIEQGMKVSVPVRYFFEPKQGLSHGWNTGVDKARGKIIAFTDDDIEVATDWVYQIKTVFDNHPEIAFIGGRVLPLWAHDVPSWLTREHWSPLALQDADAPFYTNQRNPICLLGKSFRREAFERVGNFRADLGRVKNHIGSLEDAEIQERMWSAGLQGMHAPSVIFHTDIPCERMTKSYHRSWHTGHGTHYARWRNPTFEVSSKRLFDVPAHLYRQALEAFVAWAKASLRGDADAAFKHETRLRFFYGFVRTRFRQRRNPSTENLNPHTAAET